MGNAEHFPDSHISNVPRSGAALLHFYTLWSNIAALSQTKKRGRKIGKLRFKSAFRYRTLNYNQSGFKIDREHSRITFSKIGTLPFTMHRSYTGKVKGVLITCSGDRWYVIIQVEQDASGSKHEGRSVGGAVCWDRCRSELVCSR